MRGAVIERGAAPRLRRLTPLAVVLTALGGLVPAGVLAQALPPPVDAQGRLDPRWRVVGLPEQKPPLTRYTADLVDGRTALRIDARGSYGNLVLERPGLAAPQRLSWAWKVEQANPAADLRTKAGDDSPAKVCLSFDLALERVPFVERQLLRLARARTAQALPAATLCWAWGHAEPVDTVIDNPYSRRVRTIVLRGHANGSGRWFDESRDVAADFRRAFGDESPELPRLLALGLAGDADNTQGHSIACIAALQWIP